MRLKIAVILYMSLGIPAMIYSGPCAAENNPLIVFVSILPQKFIVQQIGAQLVNVQVMVPPGAGPATYEPKPGQMAALAEASIYFSVGVPFEKAWLSRIAAANPRMKMVAGDQGIIKLPMTPHDHDSDHQFQDRRLDPHIWLAPPLIKIMARNITTALADIQPAQQARFENNFNRFEKRLDSVDGQIRQILAGERGARFLVFHPSWGYFASTYGLIQIPIEVEGKDPKPAQLQSLIQEARELKIKVIFAQPQFSTRSARVVAQAIGGTLVLADPLAPDLLDNLLRQAQAFKAAAR